MFSLGRKKGLLKSIVMALKVYKMNCFRISRHQYLKITSGMKNVCEKRVRSIGSLERKCANQTPMEVRFMWPK